MKQPFRTQHLMQRFCMAALLLCVYTLVCLTAKAEYTVYPVPQKTAYGTDNILLTKSVNVITEKGIDLYTIDRLREVMTEENGITLTFSKKPSTTQSNIYLGINNSKGKADKTAKAYGLTREAFNATDKYDRHTVALVKNRQGIADIVIIGEHTNAAFYGLATLEQILEQSTQSASGIELRETTISDYSDLQYRGIVEGYYGYPYSFAVKCDLMQFFKRYKMNTYLYGAKSDPYHSGYWRDAYPQYITKTQEKNGWLSQDMISDLALLSQKTKVNFIWAIHPNSGTAIDLHSAESTRQAVSDVMGKLSLMHDAGVRQFAVFLDDAGWDINDVDNYRDFLNNLQTSLEQKYNKRGANPSDTVMPLHYVPHIYALNFANKQDLQTYFNAISQTKSNIVVYTTGSGVWSTAHNDDFVEMHNLMKRPVALWWNYPCNDNKDGRIYTADMFSTLHEMGLPSPDPAVPQCLGIVSNPMQQGEVAKICLFGVADYAWNNRAFNSKSNWAAAFPRIVGTERAQLFRYLAKYLRYEDPDELGKMIEQYKANYDKGNFHAEALIDTLRNINKAATTVFDWIPRNQSDSLLRQELRPWLKKLAKMTDIACQLLEATQGKGRMKKEFAILKAAGKLYEINENHEYMVDALEGMGENPPSEWHPVEPSHKYLMPFIKWLVDKRQINIKP